VIHIANLMQLSVKCTTGFISIFVTINVIVCCGLFIYLFICVLLYPEF